MDLELEVLNYLTKYKNVYTKTMYYALKIKPKYGLSQNKFRNSLRWMQEEGKIKQTGFEALPYWNIVKES